MNLLDLVIVAVMLLVALGGYRLGFLARALSWVGLALGIVLAARFLPSAVSLLGAGNDPSTKALFAVALVLLGDFAGQGIGLVAGASLRQFVPHGPLRAVDSVVGAGVGVLGVLTAVWMLIPSLAEVPGSMSSQARNSAIAQAIDSRFPRPPDTLQALRRLVGEGGFPRVFDDLRPAPQAGPAPADHGMAPAVLARVAASTVKVTGAACQRVQDGSGFAVAADTVVTNAHVVAGQRPGRTQVVRTDGRRLQASVVVFDSDRDLAVLRVPGLGRQPLAVANGAAGTRGAVFGHPGGQERVRAAPAAVRRQIQAVGRDLYDSHLTRREVFVLASDLRPGDSGGALVSQAGNVIGVAFAIAPDRSGTSYAVTDKELRAALSVPRGNPVGTGPCLT